MKKTIRTIMIITLMSVAVAGCQKESVVITNNDVVDNAENNNVKHSVVYSVNGEKGRIEIEGNNAWFAFLQRMVCLAEQGYTVTICNVNNPRQENWAKEVVTYTTSDKDAAVSWADDMSAKGYTVVIYYDDTNNVFVCTAEHK
ncbi:MAG: hypothetical protein IKJ78_07115 [Bacteroidales bacterium]|nr:hypothetical protein [Bacteroidales bacterium]